MKKLSVLKDFSLSSIAEKLMSHKTSCLLAPFILVSILISIFIFNLCRNNYNFNAMLEQNQTVITVPLQKAVDNKTINKIQKLTSNLIKTQCTAQELLNYTVKNKTMENDFANYMLNKPTGVELKLTTLQNSELSDKQKETLFNGLKNKFSKIVNLNDANDIQSSKLSDLKINSKFWLQFCVAFAVLTILLLLFFGFKFKQLGFWSTSLVALTNLILSLGATFLVIVMITHKINLTFLTAAAIYFTKNLHLLFTEIKKETSSLKNKSNPFNSAQTAVEKTLPHFLFVVLILAAATACCFAFGLIFNNFIIWKFAIACSIALLIDFVMSVFLNAQLWAFLKNKKTPKIKPTAA